MAKDTGSGRSRVEKLGVKPGHRVGVLRLEDEGFLEELRTAGADVSTRRRRASDLLLVKMTRRQDLSELTRLEPYIQRAGAIWVLWPKGRRELNENHVRDAAVAEGLVDVKVASFSAELSALKLVIPVARR